MVAHLSHLLERVDHDRQEIDVVVEPEVVGHLAERLELFATERTLVAPVDEDDRRTVLEFLGQRHLATAYTRQFEGWRLLAFEGHAADPMGCVG
jgi:hypothetical protein